MAISQLVHSLTFPSSFNVRSVSYSTVGKIRRPFLRHKLFCRPSVKPFRVGGREILRVRVKVEKGMTGIMWMLLIISWKRGA